MSLLLLPLVLFPLAQLDATAPPPSAGPSLNPNISVVTSIIGAWREEAATVQAADDPRDTGFDNQETELALQANVDPFLHAEAFVVVSGLDEIEAEEVFAQTTALPANLQLKAGIFRSAFGRVNGQHLEVQSFADRPLLAPAYLGEDGLRAPGVQLSWLAPTDFYLELFGEALSVRAEAPEGAALVPTGVVATFGGGDAEELTYAGAVKSFFPLGEAHSLLVGASYATGLSPDPAGLAGEARAHLVGGDLYYKYRPASVAQGYFELVLQGEYVLRAIPERDQLDGAFYAQLVARLSRRWHAGLRVDLLGAPDDDDVERVDRISPVVYFSPTEFSRLKLQYSAERPSADQLVSAAFVQLEFSIGPHGAHPF